MNGSAAELRRKMIEGPSVFGDKAEVRLNFVHRQLPGRLIAAGDWQGEPALTQGERVHVEPKVEKRTMVEQQLDFANSELRCYVVVRAAKDDVLCDDFMKAAQAQPGKLEINALGAQFFQERLFHEAGQANLVEIKGAADQREDDEPHSYAKAAEIDSAQTPEAGFFRRCSHVR